MCGSTKRAIIILMCVCVLILSGIGSSSLWNNNGSNTATADSGIYYVEEVSPLENRFVNQVDGYGISIPKEMSVVDMSFPIAIWWNGCDFDSEGNIARPYFMDESEELLTIFKENLQEYKQ